MSVVRKLIAVVAGIILSFLLLVLGAFFYGVIRVYLWEPKEKAPQYHEEPRP